MDRKAGTGSIKTVESTFKKQEVGLSPSRQPIAAQEKPSLLGFEKTVGCREIVGGAKELTFL